MKPKPNEPQSFYRWVDADGRLHVVNSLDAVPQSERSKLERVTLRGAEQAGEPARSWSPDWQSFALGFAVALLLSLLPRLLPTGWRRATTVLLVLVAAALLTGVYLAAVRGATGAGRGAR